jgi:crossover junction endodeoxyribonuclease RuvC
MKVIGIDPGTATTGYGIVEEDSFGNLMALSFGVVLTRPDQPLEKRLQTIFNTISDLILLHQPACASVEKLFFKQNVTNAISVGQARGVVLLALANHNVAVAEYSPAEVNSAISGYGGAQKSQVQAMVKAILNLDEIPKPDDAADALAIAICHINSMSMHDKASLEG